METASMNSRMQNIKNQHPPLLTKNEDASAGVTDVGYSKTAQVIEEQDKNLYPSTS